MKAKEARLRAPRQGASPARSPGAAKRNGPSKSPVPTSGRVPAGRITSKTRGSATK